VSCSRASGSWVMGHGSRAGHGAGRFVRLGVVALAALLAVALCARPAVAERPERGPGLRSRLNLSSDQRTKLQAHVRDVRSRALTVGGELRAARVMLAGQFADYRLDERRTQESARKINALQHRLLKLNLDDQVGLRQILSREQFEQLWASVGGRGRLHVDGHIEGDREGPGDRAVERIGLSPEQQESIRKLYSTTRETTLSLRQRLSTETEGLRRLYSDYDLDAKKATARIDKLRRIQLALLGAMIARQVELRKILTEQQFQALSQSIHPPGRGPGPGPRRWHREPK